MFFILYKTTNKINGKYYVGIHKTETVEDNYLGSGKAISKAIQKYGKDNFNREIIKFCNSMEELVEEERKLVNKEMVMEDMSYNIEIGGRGGKVWTDEMKRNMSETIKETFKNGRVHPYQGKKRGCVIPKDILRQRSISMMGENNHMYGINVADIMTPEANAERLRKISEANKKPKSTTDKYKQYAKKRFWIVNKQNETVHCLDLNDPRLLDGSYIRGMKWKPEQL